MYPASAHCGGGGGGRVLHGRVPHEAVLRHGHLWNFCLCRLRVDAVLLQPLGDLRRCTAHRLTGAWSTWWCLWCLRLDGNKCLGWWRRLHGIGLGCLHGIGQGCLHGFRHHLGQPPAFLLLLFPGLCFPAQLPDLCLLLVLAVAVTRQVEVLVLVEDE